MSSYNLINGTYAHENEWLLQDLLRDQWGFDGAVVSDWGGCNDIVQSVKAGGTLEMPGTKDDSAKAVRKAVKQGLLDEKDLDQCINDLLKLVFSIQKEDSPQATSQMEQNNVARQAAEESIVLLKNEDQMLPINSAAKVAIIGDFAHTPRYQGAGSSLVNPLQLVSTLEVVKEYFPNYIGYAQGFSRKDEENEALLTAAKELAQKAEKVVLYVGLPEPFETEGQDRGHMGLPQNQIKVLEALAKVNPAITVVLCAGSPVEMPWLKHCKGLVYACLGGQAGAPAALRVLSGQVNPSGKLAETFPLQYKDLPISQNYPGTQRTAEYREGLFVGYRYFETASKPVLFPFGHGLSYTTFEYRNLVADEKEVSFTLTNTGTLPGAEVAQVYIGLKESRVFRSAKELKGFTKVYLQAGETKQVTIALNERAFGYYNVKTNQYEIETGQYTIGVGASVQNILLEKTVDVTGTTDIIPYEGLPLGDYSKANVHKVSDEAFSALLGSPLPFSKWDEKAPLTMNDTIGQLYYAKSPIARLAYKVLTRMKNKSLKKGKPDLNILFIYNMPFRGIAKMMNGMVTMDMAKSLLVMVNGQFFKGLGGFVKGFFRKNKQED